MIFSTKGIIPNFISSREKKNKTATDVTSYSSSSSSSSSENKNAGATDSASSTSVNRGNQSALSMTMVDSILSPVPPVKASSSTLLSPILTTTSTTVKTTPTTLSTSNVIKQGINTTTTATPYITTEAKLTQEKLIKMLPATERTSTVATANTSEITKSLSKTEAVDLLLQPGAGRIDNSAISKNSASSKQFVSFKNSTSATSAIDMEGNLARQNKIDEHENNEKLTVEVGEAGSLRPEVGNELLPVLESLVTPINMSSSGMSALRNLSSSGMSALRNLTSSGMSVLPAKNLSEVYNIVNKTCTTCSTDKIVISQSETNNKSVVDNMKVLSTIQGSINTDTGHIVESEGLWSTQKLDTDRVKAEGNVTRKVNNTKAGLESSEESAILMPDGTGPLPTPPNLTESSTLFPAQSESTPAPQTESSTTTSDETESSTTSTPQTESSTTSAPHTESLTTPAPQTESSTTTSDQTESSTTTSPQTESSTTSSDKTESSTTSTPQTEPSTTSTPQTESSTTASTVSPLISMAGNQNQPVPLQGSTQVLGKAGSQPQKAVSQPGPIGPQVPQTLRISPSIAEKTAPQSLRISPQSLRISPSVLGKESLQSVQPLQASEQVITVAGPQFPSPVEQTGATSSGTKWRFKPGGSPLSVSQSGCLQAGGTQLCSPKTDSVSVHDLPTVPPTVPTTTVSPTTTSARTTSPTSTSSTSHGIEQTLSRKKEQTKSLNLATLIATTIRTPPSNTKYITRPSPKLTLASITKKKPSPTQSKVHILYPNPKLPTNAAKPTQPCCPGQPGYKIDVYNVYQQPSGGAPLPIIQSDTDVIIGGDNNKSPKPCLNIENCNSSIVGINFNGKLSGKMGLSVLTPHKNGKDFSLQNHMLDLNHANTKLDLQNTHPVFNNLQKDIAVLQQYNQNNRNYEANGYGSLGSPQVYNWKDRFLKARTKDLKALSTDNQLDDEMTTSLKDVSNGNLYTFNNPKLDNLSPSKLWRNSMLITINKGLPIMTSAHFVSGKFCYVCTLL